MNEPGRIGVLLRNGNHLIPKMWDRCQNLINKDKKKKKKIRGKKEYLEEIFGKSLAESDGTNLRDPTKRICSKVDRFT